MQFANDHTIISKLHQ